MGASLTAWQWTSKEEIPSRELGKESWWDTGGEQMSRAEGAEQWETNLQI